MMKKDLAAVLLTSCLAACAQPPAPQQQAAPPPSPAAPPPEVAPPPTPRATSEAQIAPGRWDVDRVRCSDLLGAADDDRAAAAMFYYGYLAAKAGIHVIDVSQIDGNVKKGDGPVRRRAEHHGSAGLPPGSRPSPVIPRPGEAAQHPDIADAILPPVVSTT
jgi:hypothetical protein